MVSKAGRSMLMLGAAAQFAMLVPWATPAAAQRWDAPRSNDDRRPQWNNNDRRPGWDNYRHERERDRRKDAKTEGVVAGVIGTAVLATVIASIADGNKNKKRSRDHAEYCNERYGNYDPRSDTYVASDGREYRCE